MFKKIYVLLLHQAQSQLPAFYMQKFKLSICAFLELDEAIKVQEGFAQVQALRYK